MEKTSPPSVNTPLIVLIAVNFLPIVGVLFWGWNVFEIVSLYWFENIVIGAINILKMLTSCGDGSDVPTGNKKSFLREDADMPEYLRNPSGAKVLNHGVKLFLVPFFTVHYGMFCFVHGVFVFALLGGKGGRMMDGGPFTGMIRMISQILDSGGKWFVAAIIASHLFSFFYNYLGKGEYRNTSAPALMVAPYGRIVVLHIAILLGAFAITALDGPVFLLILLIIGKIVLDAKLHLRSRRSFKKAHLQ